uniref:Pre-mRNA splicing factor (Prp24) n=1 Tax=Rhipicephalus zambeziensis TaxID=60191 RepID=A0A224Z4J8_9ACAR
MKANRPDAGKSHGSWGDQRQQKGARPDQFGKRKVFVGNIGAEGREEDIRRVFEKYTVENVTMRFEGERKAHCFVVFSTEAEAEEALNGSFMLNNHPIAVKSASVRTEPSGFTPGTGAHRDHREGSKDINADKSKEVFLANLPNLIEEEHILQLFERFGPEKVVLKKPDNKKPFAFLTLRDPQAAADAIGEMNNHVFLGKKIGVMASGQRGGSSTQPNRNAQPNSFNSSHGGSSVEESWDSTSSPAPSSAPWPNSKSVQNGNNFSHKSGNSEESWDSVPSAPVIAPEAHSSSASSEPSLDGPPMLCKVSDALGAGDMPLPLIRVRNSGPSTAPKRAVLNMSEQTAVNGVDSQDGPPPLDRVSAQGSHGKPRQEGPPAVGSPNEVFVGNLKTGVTEDEMRNMFAKYGVVNISLKAKGPKPICFIELESAASVDRAVQDLNGASMGNQQNLTVRKADGTKPKQKPQKAEAPAAKDPFSNANKLFVANLPKNITKDDIRNIFDKYGVQETFLITTKGAPYAFVTLSSQAAFNKALQEMQGFTFQDHKLFIGLPSKRDGSNQAQFAPKTNAAPADAPAAGSNNPSHSSEPSPVVLCIANFPPETKMAEIADLFSSWDPIEVVMGKSDSSGLGSYTHAYVTVADRDTAETAVLNLNDTYFNGRIIAVVPLPKNCKKVP